MNQTNNDTRICLTCHARYLLEEMHACKDELLPVQEDDAGFIR